jgi:pilus assembly protein CpaE
MSAQVNCVIVDADAQNRQDLAGFLANCGVQIVGQFNTPEALAPLLGRSDSPHLAIINLDPNAHESLKKYGHLPRQFPQTSFFLMSQVLDANLLMEAMHLGVREFIPLPIAEDKFAAAVDRTCQQFGMAKKGKIIHFIPTMGGCGSTTVACNVAASLAKSAKTVLLDLDLVRGGVASYFDIRARYTIADIMESGDKLDKQLLDNALARHQGSGLSILARPDLPEDTQRVKQAGFARLLNFLCRMFDFVVMDSIMSIDPLYATAVQSSDLNVIIMQLNVPSAKNTERFVGTLRRMAIDSNKIKIVANRYIKKGWDIEPAEVERTLGLKISWTIPNDFKTAISAINLGEPLVLRAPRTEISQSMAGLANLLAGKGTVANASAA